MSKLTAIRKQIAALEAEAERITKQEMSGAIAKVKEIMSTFGLTIEHLQAAVSSAKRATSKKATPNRLGKGIAKYADPKTGKTWSGFGRAPAWMAGAKNRDAFLVDKSGIKAPDATAKAPVEKKKSAARAASAKKVAKPVAKKVVAAAKKATREAAAPAAAKKKPLTKKAALKGAAKKSTQKRAASSAQGAQASTGSAAALAT